MAQESRIDRAFEALEREWRILPVENASCCTTCSHGVCRSELNTTGWAVGYIFYHAQDLDLAAGGCRALRGLRAACP